MTEGAETGPKGYSLLQIVLHWTIAALIIFQLIVNDGMQEAFDDMMDDDSIDDLAWAILHIAVGATVLLLAIVRVIVRLTRGAPAPEGGRAAIINGFASATHLALYGLIFMMPLTGALAWFGQNDASAELHELGRQILIPLIVLHVAGAFVEHFVFHNDTVLRMLSPVPREKRMRQADSGSPVDGAKEAEGGSSARTGG